MENKNFTPEELPKYREHYSERAFTEKLKNFATKAGSKVVYFALLLYYTLSDPKTPKRYRAVIIGALGYFILPVDLLPDFIPFTGMADDWAALIAAVTYVTSAITPEIRLKAQARLEEIF